MLILMPGLISVIILIIIINKRHKKVDKKLDFDELNRGLVLYMLFNVIYFFIIALMSCVPLYFIVRNKNLGDGAAALMVVPLGVCLIISPIASLITTLKIINKKYTLKL